MDVRLWTYQPGLHKRKVTQDFSTFLRRCLPYFSTRVGFSRSFSSSTVNSNFVYVWINLVWLPILLVVSWTGKMIIPLSPYVPENLVSRDRFTRPVPRQPAHLHTQTESGAYSRDSSRFPRRRPFIYLNRHTPLGQSRVYRVTQLRTNSVHRRESASTGPVVLKVVTDAAILQVTVDQLMCASLFPHPLLV